MLDELTKKYVQSQKTGEWVEIDMTDMDYHSTFSKTLQELKVSRMALNKIINDQDDESIDWEREFNIMTDAVNMYNDKYKELLTTNQTLKTNFRKFLEDSNQLLETETAGELK
jgi:hypothetical protein